MTPAWPLLILDVADDVAVARRDLAAGETLGRPGGELTVRTAVASGHKIALADLPAGAPVLKYGFQIGVTSRAIAAGEHVHTHNLVFSDHAAPSAAGHGTRGWRPPALPTRRSFLGCARGDGSTATRNHIAVISTVNCSATVCRQVAAEIDRRGLLAGYPQIDGVLPVTHTLGCGSSRDGVDVLRRTLGGFARHPNVGGVVIIGLGCEVNQVSELIAGLRLRPQTPLTHLTIQQTGGSRATIEAAIAAIVAMAPQVAESFTRTERPVSELVLGLNCGGSDGLSGLTANPALGFASDLIVAQRGRSVLAESPEVYGAEALLVARAESAAIAQRLLDKLTWWEEYTAAQGATMDANPSPGNKAGGITTILEKSLGAVAKSGRAPLRAVYDYAAPIDTPGLGFMDTPGYDPVSVTGLIAGGANLICFTTGRGSAIGTRPAPTLKLATNDALFARMPDDLDINCGPIFSGATSPAEKGLEIYHALLDLASGTPSKSEELGYGVAEFVPWQLGAVL